jgi:dimethyl sulfoxide reductase iron-sulfur subunit
MPRYGMVIDLDACIGCRACMVACKVENNTPEGAFWMSVFRLEKKEYPQAEVSFLPRPCMHCDDAPCVKVCPVGARFKREDGLVLTDYDRCIGCRYCQVACPYGVNSFNWKQPEEAQYGAWDDPDVDELSGGAIPPYKNPDHEGLKGDEQRRTAGSGHHKGVIEKCTFCVHRVEKNLAPACVSNCPAYAMFFGDLDDPQSVPSRILAKSDSFRLLEDKGLKPRVHYVGGTPPDGETRTIEPIKSEVK